MSPLHFFSIISSIDLSIARYVSYVHTASLDRFFLLCTVLGNVSTIIAILIGLTLVAFFMHHRHAWSVFFVAILTAFLSSSLIKMVIQRARPTDALIALPASYSFPSGHALIGTVCYGMIGYYVYKHRKNAFVGAIGIFIMTAVPLLIGISRVYLGVHWFSDVLAGWVIGALIVAGFILHIRHIRRTPLDEISPAGKYVLLFCIVTIESLLVFLFYFLS